MQHTRNSYCRDTSLPGLRVSRRIKQRIRLFKMCQVPDRALRAPKQSKRRYDVHRILSTNNGVVITYKSVVLPNTKGCRVNMGSLLYVSELDCWAYRFLYAGLSDIKSYFKNSSNLVSSRLVKAFLIVPLEFKTMVRLILVNTHLFLSAAKSVVRSCWAASKL